MQVRAVRRARHGHGRRFDGLATGTDRQVRRVGEMSLYGTGRQTGRPSTGRRVLPALLGAISLVSWAKMSD